jgi:regulator of protease activity HflC (stomatin/prohibitin superfamily)
MRGIFSRNVRNLGILSYQFVKRTDGNTLLPGQGWNPADLTFFSVFDLVESKVLRNRGIKVISAGFSDLEPTSEKVKDRLLERWSAGWEKEATIITADHELQAMRIRNLARAEAQGEMVAALALILGNTPLSEEAMAIRVFQALEIAASDPKTHQLLPGETINMLNNLQKWLEE